jgi:aminoglycoside phosphotransferase (APT) family kinase protein
MPVGSYPEWLPLLQKPYENLFGPKNTWDFKCPDGRPLHVERNGQGLNNVHFRVTLAGEAYACKMFPIDDRHRAQREWDALVALDDAALSLAPRPLAFAPEGPLPLPAIVCRWIDGKALSAIPMREREVTNLVEAMQSIHAAEIGGTALRPAWGQPTRYEDYLAEMAQHLAVVRQWCESADSQSVRLPAWISDLCQLLPALEMAYHNSETMIGSHRDEGSCRHPALVRLDGSLENLVKAANSEVAFLDWDFSGAGDPAFDLAVMRWHPRIQAIAPADWQTALGQYRPSSSDREFRSRLEVYLALLPVRWACYSARHLVDGRSRLTAQHRPVRIPDRLYISAHRQLHHYLATLNLIEADDEDDSEKE